MRISLNWIKEYVELDISPEELAEKLTMVGLEVDSIEYLGEGISKIFTGEIRDVLKHPNADKLSLCIVDVNAENQGLGIVCGAPNVKKGQRIVVALPGATLPGGIKIKKAKIRGQVSLGMICSAKELGIDDSLIPEHQKQGIIVLDNQIPVGLDAKEVLGLDDVVLVLDLTPNRSDCLSLMNVAVEVAAVTGGKLKKPEVILAEIQSDQYKTTVTIEDNDLCERYVARTVTGVNVSSSPLWMQKRLQASGIRPINNVVDITNYVLLETGQPLHAFDADLVENQNIIVRRAECNEVLTTLDGKERKLSEKTLVIADPKGAIAIAGVMGGHRTEVTQKSKNIIIEAAHFNPISVRRTSKALNLRSEASFRFEKGIDKERVLLAAERAAQLMAQLAGGTVLKNYVDNYPVPYLKLAVNLHVPRVNSVIGAELTATQVKSLLESIGLDCMQDSSEVLVVSIPSYRGDIVGEIDLIEEVARLYGYDKIPVTLPSGACTSNLKSKKHRFEALVKNFLVYSGAYEIITYSFINPNQFDKLNLPDNHSFRKAIEVSNPLSEDGRIMRTTLIPNLMDTMLKNIHRNVRNPIIFEIGKVFSPSQQLLPKETNKLGILLMGKYLAGWNWPEVSLDFYYLKGIVEQLVESLVMRLEIKPISFHPFLHPGKAGEILVEDLPVGMMGEIGPLVKENYGITDAAYVCEIDLDQLAALYSGSIVYEEIPKYPSVERDLAVVIKKDVAASNLLGLIKKSAYPLLKDLRLFDVYQGEQIPAGYKSLAFSLIYQAKDRTLTDEEVNCVHKKVQDAVINELSAKLRE